ncbi:MAG: carboxypeptidase regulatory-like domain-containing protein [Planctomycetes bacterium]|nr:carboxypeptidase regulatory-like domain-containing protein [Planctomycetota bacterium]
MRTRDFWTLAATLSLIASLGLVFLGQETWADGTRPDAHEPAHVATSETRTANGAPTDAAAVVSAQGPEAAPAIARKSEAGVTDATTGVIRGDIPIAVSILDRIQSITIHVEEGRNAIDGDGQFRPRRTFLEHAKLGPGTPTFEVRNVPFSEYPWIVTAFAPGLNGGRATVMLNAEHPVADVALPVTPAAPFTILLRDQDQAPYVGVEIVLQPVGEPAGRPKKVATTDSYGSAVYEDLLGGEYRAFLSIAGQPLEDPQSFVVPTATHVVASTVQGHGTTITIARGMPLQVRVADVRGYGLADVTVTATATDQVRHKAIELTTDATGVVTFPRLLPGTWQIDVQRTDYQRSTRQVTARAGEPIEPIEFQLVRLR